VLGGEASGDDLNDSALRPGNILFRVGQPSEHPPGQQFVDRAVEDVARQARVEVGADDPALAVEDALRVFGASWLGDACSAALDGRRLRVAAS